MANRNFCWSHFKFEIDQAVQYVEKVTSLLDEEKTRFEQHVKANASGMSPEDEADYYEWMADCANALPGRPGRCSLADARQDAQRVDWRRSRPRVDWCA